MDIGDKVLVDGKAGKVFLLSAPGNEVDKVAVALDAGGTVTLRGPACMAVRPA